MCESASTGTGDVCFRFGRPRSCPPRTAGCKRLSSGGHERLADLLQSERARWRQPAVGTHHSGNSSARYCNNRFGEEWHLSPEQSLLLHGERTVIPDQVVVNRPKGQEQCNRASVRHIALRPEGTCDAGDGGSGGKDGLRLFSPAAALVRVVESFFRRNPFETQVVLASLGDASDLLSALLNGGHSAKAGYLAGAFRQTGRPDWAGEIMGAMKSAGYDVRESNPSRPGRYSALYAGLGAPIVGRMEMLWESMRGAVVETFPEEPGLSRDRDAYLRFVDGIYQSDAYHSLSIEGYSVTPETIERVRQGDWDPEHHEG